jgi:membrane-bound ClpP family serine protease
MSPGTNLGAATQVAIGGSVAGATVTDYPERGDATPMAGTTLLSLHG